MPTNQTYTLATIADLMRVVTPDNIHSLVADLHGLLANVCLTKATIGYVLTDEVAAQMFEGVTVKWTDDGVNKQTISAKGQDGTVEFVTTGSNNAEPAPE